MSTALRRRVPAAALALAALLAPAACGGGADDAASVASPTTQAPTTTSASTTTSTTTTSTTTTTAPPTTTTAPPTTTTAPPPPPTTTTAPPPPPPPPPRPDPSQVLCVGDSVMLGAGPQYADALPSCGIVDAAESRQLSSAPEVLAQHLGPGIERVVLHLGTNGEISPGTADAVLGSLAAVPKVLVVNVQLNGSRPWEGPVNQVLADAVARHPNAVLVDWKAASDGHPEYFSGDGIHMAAAGAQVYGFVIAANI